MVSHPELSLDPPIGSDRETGRDNEHLLSRISADRTVGSRRSKK